MTQTDVASATDRPAPGPLAALLPAPFVARLIEPLFAAPDRAALATELLGPALAFACVQLCRRPAADLEALHRDAAIAGLESRRLRATVVRLLDGFAAEGVNGVAIKGFATALSVYPQPALRAFTDVDVLFRERDLPRLARLLADRGFRTATAPGETRAWGALTEASFAPIFPADKSINLDVHRAVDEPPAGSGLGAGVVFERAEAVKTEWGRCRVAAPEHGFAIAALHAFRDFYQPDGLKGVFDACLILRRFGEGLDWEHIEAAARRGGFVKRMVFYRELLDELGAGRAPVFMNRRLSPRLGRQLAAIARNDRELGWLRTGDARKVVLEASLLDTPFTMLRLYWRRLSGLVAPKSHTLPGVPLA